MANATPSSRPPKTDTERELRIRAGYLQFLPRVSKAHLLVLRAAAAAVGWDFSEEAWELFARTHDLPSASTFARLGGGGSFAFAKFLAAVGPLPPHPGGSRFKMPRRLVSSWDAESLLLGAMTVARVNGGWPTRDGFDEAARKARARGVVVPLIDVVERRLGVRYGDVRRLSERLAAAISDVSPAYRTPATYERADAVARGMARGVEFLHGDRPSSDAWDDVTREYRREGVPSMHAILRAFGSYRAGWTHVEKLGLQPGQQADARPRYTTETIARGLALAESELGFRPNSAEWTNAVRPLKRAFGPGTIPGKPTIYAFFASWELAWACVDTLRRQGII